MDAGDPAGEAATFLSPAWFEHARSMTAGLPDVPGLSWRLQFGAVDGNGEHQRWYQVVEDGRVVAWERGELDATELELRWTIPHARAVHRREVSGTDALAATLIVSSDGSVGPPPPLDIEETDELDRLPTIPGATLTIQYEFPRGPFGPVSYWMAFDDGRSAGMGLGRTDEPDVQVEISFSKMVRVRTGEISIIQALENGGRVDGPIGPLMLLAGLEEAGELHAAELACGPAGSILARIGELSATPEYQAASVALAGLTD